MPSRMTGVYDHRTDTSATVRVLKSVRHNRRRTAIRGFRSGVSLDSMALPMVGTAQSASAAAPRKRRSGGE
jgi:hypothetical protein